MSDESRQKDQKDARRLLKAATAGTVATPMFRRWARAEADPNPTLSAAVTRLADALDDLSMACEDVGVLLADHGLADS